MSTTTKKKTEDSTVPDFDNNKTYTQQNYELTDYLFNKAYNDFGQRFTKANEAAVALQRQQQQQSEDAFYRNLYDTNQTVLDTIRKNNASAIASGASKGTQAANELAAMLGMQQESVDSATQLAQQGYDLAAEQQQSALQASVDAAQAASGLTSNLASALSTSQQADAVRYQTEFESNRVKELIQGASEGDAASLLELSIMAPEYAKEWIDSFSQQAKIKNLFNNPNVTPSYRTERDYSATSTRIGIDEGVNGYYLEAQLPKYNNKGELTNSRFGSTSDLELGYASDILNDTDFNTVSGNKSTENVTMVLTNNAKTKFIYAVYKDGRIYAFHSADPTSSSDNIANAVKGMLTSQTNVFAINDIIFKITEEKTSKLLRDNVIIDNLKI